MIFSKTILFSCLRDLNHSLRMPVFAPPNIKKFSFGCGEKIAMGIKDATTQNDLHVIRMWNANTYFGLWHDNFLSSTFLGALDYRVYDNHIKIEYMSVYDDEYKSNMVAYYYRPPLNCRAAIELNNAMIDYVVQRARELEKPKIIVDVHRNLRIFDKYYKSYGFTATERRCSDNWYWVEAELDVGGSEENL